MPLSTIIGLIWVLFVSAWAKGWSADHTWLPLWIFILGIAFVVLRVLEYLAVVRYTVPARTRRGPADTAI